MNLTWSAPLCCSDYGLFDLFFVAALYKSLHVRIRYFDTGRIKAPDARDLIVCCYTDIAKRGGRWLKIGGWIAEDQIAAL